MSPALAVFVRAPVRGEVKSRLAATMGEVEAVLAYEQLVAHTLDQLRPLRYRSLVRELWVAGNLGHPKLQEWSLALNGRILPQQGIDLGARMWYCIRLHLRMQRAVVLVGSDIPNLDAAYVDEALRALQDVDVVLGPAADGGYGLIGVSANISNVFQGVSWGTPEVLQQTLTRIHEAGHSVEMLGELWDVDDEQDWRRFLLEYAE